MRAGRSARASMYGGSSAACLRVMHMRNMNVDPSDRGERLALSGCSACPVYHDYSARHEDGRMAPGALCAL